MGKTRTDTKLNYTKLLQETKTKLNQMKLAWEQRERSRLQLGLSKRQLAAEASGALNPILTELNTVLSGNWLLKPQVPKPYTQNPKPCPPASSPFVVLSVTPSPQQG